MCSINSSKERLACQQPRWLRNFLWSIRPQKPYVSDLRDFGLLFLPDSIYELQRVICGPIENQQITVDRQVLSQQGTDSATRENRDASNIVQRQPQPSYVQNLSGGVRKFMLNLIFKLFTSIKNFQPADCNPGSNFKDFICVFSKQSPFLTHAEIRQPQDTGNLTDMDIMIALHECLVEKQPSKYFRKLIPMVPYKFELYEVSLMFAKRLNLADSSEVRPL